MLDGGARREESINAQAPELHGFGGVKARIEREMGLGVTRNACESIRVSGENIRKLQSDILTKLNDAQAKDPTLERATEIEALEKEHRHRLRRLRLRTYIATKVGDFYGLASTTRGAVSTVVSAMPTIAPGLGLVGGKTAAAGAGAAAGVIGSLPVASGLLASLVLLGGTTLIMKKWKKDNIEAQDKLTRFRTNL